MTWHRFHPLTPFLRGGVMIAAVFGWLLSQQFSRVFGAPADDPTGGHWGIAAVGIVVVVSGGVLLGWISWRAARYRLGSSTVELKSGVVFRQHRQVRYDRIQAVEITRPLMARLVGLSSVKVEAAGGLMSSIQLAYLPHAQALDIRADLLAQARSREVAGPRASSEQGVGVMPAAPVSGSFPDAAIWPAPQGAAYDLPAPEGAPVDGLAPGAPVDGLAPGAPRVQPALAAAGEVPARWRGIPMGSDDVIDGAQQIAAIPAARVWAATGFSGSTLFLIPAIPVLIFALINRSLGILPWLGPMVLALIGQQAGKLTSWANFRVLATDDAILVRHGLTELRSATIPVRRVQAIEVSQPLLWRPFDWWKVQVNVAGVLQIDPTETALIPIGTRAEVLAILAAMGPTWSIPEVIEGMDAPGRSPHFVSAPTAARWLDPLSWQRTGYAVTSAALITRGGWLGRHTQLVPHARMQSLQLKQGPLERRLKLASVRTLSTMGPVVPEVRHLSITDATALIGDQMVRCALARRADGSARPPADQGVPGALSSSLSESTTGDSRSSLRME